MQNLISYGAMSLHLKGKKISCKFYSFELKCETSDFRGNSFILVAIEKEKIIQL